MWVTILAREYEKYPEYYGATLWMPATRAALQDAMEQVRVPGGGSCRLTRLDGWPKFLAERLSRMEADIQEVNVLADKINQIGRESIPWYEGVIGCVESERGGRECSVKDLINAAGNLEYFGFLPWIVSDTDLGESAVNGGSVQMLQGLPDEVLAFLDKEKVGSCLRETEKGVFTKEGYCYRVKEGWQKIYNGQNLPEQETGSDAILSVSLENRKHSEHGKVWLSLPCSTEGMASTCASLHAESLEQCRIWEVRSAVPILEKKIQFYDDVEMLNELAERLQQMPQKELIKYKAVLQFENWKNIEEALLLTERLDCYVFDLVFVTTMGSPVLRYHAEKEIKKVVKEINEQEAFGSVQEQREPHYFEDMYPHAIRHTFCSRCFEAGMQPKVVQSIMGHQHYSTTIDIYTHVSESKYQEEVGKFGRAMELEESSSGEEPEETTDPGMMQTFG